MKIFKKIWKKDLSYEKLKNLENELDSTKNLCGITFFSSLLLGFAIGTIVR